MATSGSHASIAKTNNGSGLATGSVSFSWERINTNLSTNTSTISWRIIVSANDGYKCNSGNEDITLSIDYLNDNGTYTNLYKHSKEVDTDTSVNGSKTIWSGSTTIPHKRDSSGGFKVNISDSSGLDIWFYRDIIAPLGVAYVDQDFPATFELDTLDRGAKITLSEDFTDEIESLDIFYENPVGEQATTLQACISFTGAKDDIPYRDIDKNGILYTFNFTEEERKILRKGITTGNSRQVRIYVKSIINDITYWDYITKTLTLVNYEPILAPNVIDTNARTIALTGSNKKFIKYYSNAYYTTGATARKEATLTSQYVTNGATTIENQSSGTIEGVTSNTFYFGATDSRGYSIKDFELIDFVPYIPLTAYLSTGLLISPGNLTFTVRGKYFEGSFGAVDNSMEIEYLLEDKNGEAVFASSGEESGWVRLGTVEPSVDSDGNYTFSHTITGLDYLGASYKLTVNVIDALSPIQNFTTVITAEPVFDWSRESFHHHSDVSFSRNIYIRDEELADFVIEQGTSGDWFYRKWNSGRVELSCEQYISDLACNARLGDSNDSYPWYRTAVQSAPYFPFTVVYPQVTVNYESAGYGALVWATTLTNTAKPFDYYLIRPTSSAGITGKVIFYVVGAWKAVG